MSRRDWYESRLDKRVALELAEEKGLVADSSEYRHALMLRVRSGECTLEQALAEMRAVKRDAKKNGKKTRSQIWRSA